MKPWLHPPDELLRAFVDEALDEAAAVQLAVHLDDCPQCQRRLQAVDSLGAMLATGAEPQPPPELVHQALRVARQGQGPGRVNPLVPALGSGMAVAAAVVFVLAGRPGALFSDLGALASAGLAIADAVELPLAMVTPVWAALAVLAFAAAAMTARRLERESNA